MTPNVRNLRRLLMAVSAMVSIAPSAFAYNMDPGYYDYDGGMSIEGPSGPAESTGPSLPPPVLSFQGITQVDVRSLHSNFSAIPPDTMGAVGATQFMETSNGAYAVYDKKTGLRTQLIGDGAFWAAAGLPAPYTAGLANGDSRVLFDKKSQRWIVTSFGPSLEQIQIAVSKTSDATGPWQATLFSAFSDGHGTGIADYPTLAIDNKAVYIGTNDFTQTSGACGAYSLCGTTLNVINRNDLFGPGAPTTASLKQFNTPLFAADTGFAIQGVNQVEGSTDNGKIVAIGLLNYGPVRYDINNAGSPGATSTAPVLVDTTPYDTNSSARQPDGSRVIDPLDDRISSAAWEWNGKIYAVHTITPVGSDHTAIEWYVINAATNAVVQKGVIGGNGDGFDYYQGTIVVNKYGQVVISYNRSGFQVDVGKISILAQVYDQIAGGHGAIASRGERLLYVSPLGDYHNGSPESSPPNGRQRWGDYAQVTVDPDNPFNFWIIGEYAYRYDSPASFSRWGTWISVVNTPEPLSISLFGAGLAGAFSLARYRSKKKKSAAA